MRVEFSTTVNDNDSILLLDYCTKTPTDFHPGFPVTFFSPYIITQLRSVSCVSTIKIGDWRLDWISIQKYQY